MMELTAKRTSEQVEASAKAAGLGSTRGPTQLLHFSPQLNTEEVKLLELPGDVLGALRSGQRVVIRGDTSEDAVLCTDDRTYDVRAADTSNTLLLLPTLSLPAHQSSNGQEDRTLVPAEVTGCLSTYFELRPCRPKLEKLKILLNECPYRGPEYEGKEEEGAEQEEEGEEGGLGGTVQPKKKKAPKKYSLDELQEHVQASECELWQALDRLQACMVGGYWRVLEADYRDRVFHSILTLLEEQDWSYTRVPLHATCSKLDELEPRFAVEHCIKCFGSEVECGMDSNGDVYYELSEERVCQFYAELLLRAAGKFNYHEFMESWQQSVPDGMTTDLGQLKGLALRDMASIPPVIWHFPASALPQEPAARFSKLFAVREKWTHSDMEPYIRDLETPTQSLNALLLKYARCSTGPRGQKVYNLKRTL